MGRWLLRCWRRRPGLVGDPGRLVERHEHRAVIDFHEASLREQIGQACAVTWGIVRSSVGQMTRAGLSKERSLSAASMRQPLGVVATYRRTSPARPVR